MWVRVQSKELQALDLNIDCINFVKDLVILVQIKPDNGYKAHTLLIIIQDQRIQMEQNLKEITDNNFYNYLMLHQIKNGMSVYSWSQVYLRNKDKNSG